jgi:hypothetical protein
MGAQSRISAAAEHGAAALRVFADKLGLERFVDGNWFRKLAIEHIRRHHQKINIAHRGHTCVALDMEECADALIHSACKKACYAGAFASAGASTGELFSLFSEGVGAPVGVAAILVSLLSEAAYTTMLQLDLACDLGTIYGAPFNVDDIGDLTTLFGLALDLPERKRPAAETAQPPTGLIEHLLELEDGEVARHIGRKLLEDSLMRNLVPFAGIAISARWNYVAIRRLGGTVRRYVRYRRTLLAALRQLQFQRIAEPEILVEGAWLLATVDGKAATETAMAIGQLVSAFPEECLRQIACDRAFGDDEEGWFDTLRLVPANMYCALMDVLYLVAAADRVIQTGERRFLRRVGRALGIPVDLERVDKIRRHLVLGEELPPGLACPAG